MPPGDSLIALKGRPAAIFVAQSKVGCRAKTEASVIRRIAKYNGPAKANGTACIQAIDDQPPANAMSSMRFQHRDWA